MTKKYDVIGFCDALVDIHADVDDKFLIDHSIPKGGMHLVDRERAEHICSKIKPKHTICGGSVANSMVDIASMGGKTAFVGKVADDDLGAAFKEDLLRWGVSYNTDFSNGFHPTGRSIVMVTPDGERTFNTYLGACFSLSTDDIDEELIKEGKIVYLSGYLWDCADKAARSAISYAKKHGVKVAFNLSDSFCVEKYRDVFHELVAKEVDILLCNDSEIKSFFQTEDIGETFSQAAEKVKFCAITLGKDGSVVIEDGKMHRVDPIKVSKVVDTTGAGDSYAAGLLYGLSHGHSAHESGTFGAKAAAEIIGYYGAKPQKPLKDVIL